MSPLARLFPPFALVLALGAPALAQPASKSAATQAQALFDEAMRLMKSDRAAEACPKLEASQRLDPGMATQFRLGECYEQMGRVASAWSLYIEVAEAAKKQKMPDREQFARKRAAAIEGRVARLTITVPPALAMLEGLEIARDGAVVAKEQWGAAIPVDPGEHQVTARAPGRAPWEAKVNAGAQGGSTRVDVGPLEDARRAEAPRPSVPTPPPGEPAGKRSVVPGVVMGGLALAGVGVGAALMGLSASSRSDGEALRDELRDGPGGDRHCAVVTDPRCADLDSHWQSVDTFHNAAIGAFIGAGVLAAGAVTWFVWPKSKEKKAAIVDWRAVPSVGPSGSALWVTGAF